jgi:hypothetical protein
MVHIDTSAERYLDLACKKVNLDAKILNPLDYVLYGLTTISESDFG